MRRMVAESIRRKMPKQMSEMPSQSHTVTAPTRGCDRKTTARMMTAMRSRIIHTSQLRE